MTEFAPPSGPGNEQDWTAARFCWLLPGSDTSV